jgi:signal transduction histidine kinase/CheY-like chemotaxis protein
MSSPLLTMVIQFEHDVVVARQRARQIAALLGFDGQGQTRIATAVSEMARNAYQYAGRGKVEFFVEGKTAPQVLVARISDQGPGIEQLQRILEGEYHSTTGMGLGIVGARRLMDRFQIDSTPGRGTTVDLRKLFRKGAPSLDAGALSRISQDLLQQRPEDPFQELQRQNQELLRTLDELRQHQHELIQVNRELEDTNRGVVALYAELDEKADHLRRADELKSRFLSNMSHEFRTPLNSILALSRLLLERVDGELTPEQEKQTQYIRRAAGELLELVNDLLDLAKIEAGKTVVRPVEFDVETLFSALRGMLRPLLVNESVRLVFEDPDAMPQLYTDEGKVSQILRNLISNALKFTERGEVRISAVVQPDSDAVAFRVTDTGIGIALADLDRIFREFSQLENPIQKKVRGTGLGLPLTKKLTELLGGTITVESQVGQGSTFTVVIPLVYADVKPLEVTEVIPVLDETRLPILLVEDEPSDVLIYQKFLKGTQFQVVPARSLREARLALQTFQPKAIILDMILQGEDAWSLLADLKKDDRTRSIPVLVVTTVEDQQKALGLGADAYHLKPADRQWLLAELNSRTATAPPVRVLMVDDQEVCRYLLKGILSRGQYEVVEASEGVQGVRRAREDGPDVILLDLMMPDMSGWEVLKQLKEDPSTSRIPVFVITSKVLEEEEQAYLSSHATGVFKKDSLAEEQLLSAIKEAASTARVLTPR